jgi:hypothetical protein
MGIRMSEVPVEHLEKLVSNVVKQRGVEEATFCVLRDIPLSMAFSWIESPEGQQFWDDIDEQRSSSGSTSSSHTAELQTLTEEAERRGFAIGVRTEHGEIVKGYAHELLPNGDFFYSNIKVFKQGKWIKPIKTKQTTNDDMPELAAIHALFSDLINGLRRN